MIRDRIRNSKAFHSKIIATTSVWSVIILYISVVGFEMSLVELLAEQVRIHLFGILFGALVGGGIAQTYFNENHYQSFQQNKMWFAIAGGLAISLILGLTVINTEISSILLIYTGIGFSATLLRNTDKN